jgi:hypothetical protein
MSVSAPLVSLMVRLQGRVRRHPGLVQSIRSVRNLLHFGPWRRIALTYVRITAPAQYRASNQPSVAVSPVKVQEVVQSLETEGYFAGLRIRPELVRKTAEFLSDKEPGWHIDVHLKSEALGRIATEPEVLRVVRTYFGCEPLLIECKLFVSKVNQVDILSTGFHFDHAGVRSLNVMVYLNDVDLETGPHVLVAGTQRGKKLRDYFREMTPIAEIERRYPEQIRTITGPAGTVLIENAEVFHRRLAAQKRRHALIVVFSTNRRRLLSIGRDRRA